MIFSFFMSINRNEMKGQGKNKKKTFKFLYFNIEDAQDAVL